MAGLAGVSYFGGDELVVAALDAFGHLVQQRHALGHGHFAPWAVQRFTRRADGGVDFRFASLVDKADDAVIGRVAVLECAGAGDPLAIDEVAKFLRRHGVFLCLAFLDC
ncbi:hypothetical protein D9M68_389540 [compost metagenome]